MKHTQGPWVQGRTESGWGVTPRVKVQNRCLLFIDNPDNCANGNIIPSEADARLIAAAPELLEACKLAEKYFREMIIGPETHYPEVSSLRAAIAKAEGSHE